MHSTKKPLAYVFHPNHTQWAEATGERSHELPWQSPVLPPPSATRTAQVPREVNIFSRVVFSQQNKHTGWLQTVDFAKLITAVKLIIAAVLIIFNPSSLL